MMRSKEYVKVIPIIFIFSLLALPLINASYVEVKEGSTWLSPVRMELWKDVPYIENKVIAQSSDGNIKVIKSEYSQSYYKQRSIVSCELRWAHEAMKAEHEKRKKPRYSCLD